MNLLQRCVIIRKRNEDNLATLRRTCVSEYKIKRITAVKTKREIR